MEPPTIILAPRAWESDPFWRDVVQALTNGKKLRSYHYLETLTAEDLDQLHRALATPLSLKQQRELCPPRRSGGQPGSLPHPNLLSGIGAAIRRVQKLRDLQVENLVENASVRCRRLGIDMALTNQLVELVATDVLAQNISKSLARRRLPSAACSFTSNPCAVNPSKNKKK